MSHLPFILFRTFYSPNANFSFKLSCLHHTQVTASANESSESSQLEHGIGSEMSREQAAHVTRSISKTNQAHRCGFCQTYKGTHGRHSSRRATGTSHLPIAIMSLLFLFLTLPLIQLPLAIQLPEAISCLIHSQTVDEPEI